MKILKLKNYYFVGGIFPGQISLGEWLSKQLLHGSVSRARTRFLRLLQPRMEELDKERGEMSERHAEKKTVKGEEMIVFLDEKGKDTTDRKNGKTYKIIDVEKFNKEYNAYINEELIIDVTPANSKMIYEIRDLLLNTEEVFGGGMAGLYNTWCEDFEGIAEAPKEKKEKEEKKA